MTMCWLQASPACCSGQTRTGCRLWVTPRLHGICICGHGAPGSPTATHGMRCISRRWRRCVVKSWPYVAALAAGLIIGWIWNGVLWGERYAELERDHAQHLAAQQAASADVISRTLLRERELHNQLEEHEQNAQAEKERLARDLADSNAVARRMREMLDDISGRLGADTGTAAECAAA